MTKLHIQGAALVAMLVSLPLISWGSTSDVPAATITGAVLLALGLLSLTVLHFVNLEGEEGG